MWVDHLPRYDLDAHHLDMKNEMALLIIILGALLGWMLFWFVFMIIIFVSQGG